MYVLEVMMSSPIPSRRVTHLNLVVVHRQIQLVAFVEDCDPIDMSYLNSLPS